MATNYTLSIARKSFIITNYGVTLSYVSGSARTLSDSDVQLIINTILAHPDAAKIMTFVKYIGLK
jgi:hypothetical protein